MRSFVVALIAAGFAVFAAGVWAQETQPVLTGDTGVHDPSWTAVGGTQVVFGTGVERAPDGGAIRVKTSADGVVWADAGAIGQGVPAWVKTTIGAVPPNIWAPSAFTKDGTTYLYYAVSTFGTNVSAIGLMTNAALDPKAPTGGWVDRGPVITSTRSDTFNAIDPARIDTSGGRAWLAFGSWWDGIKMREIDPITGMTILGNDTLYSLASRQGGAIEAPSILEHDGRFYLFVSFDLCCRGVASTYSIRVGRADAVSGPYVDRDGKPMMEGGGTLVMSAGSDVRGPGGQEAFATAAGDILVYHYYSIRAGGAPKLQIAPIRWSDDGWPSLDPLP